MHRSILKRQKFRLSRNSVCGQCHTLGAKRGKNSTEPAESGMVNELCNLRPQRIMAIDCLLPPPAPKLGMTTSFSPINLYLNLSFQTFQSKYIPSNVYNGIYRPIDQGSPTLATPRIVDFKFPEFHSGS
uniref:Uncharacterized protein n=1 Tax=Micrurus paraensis TaxID=1970185 RepID=A0A2D4L2N0_9SAUR